jgi:ATP-binding cassette subfamily C (CFTR/MRP) protein 1
VVDSISVQRFYRSSARELQRLDSISKSPIYESFSESLSGCATVRAFRKSSQFIENNQDRIDKNLRAGLVAFGANRWLAVRLEFLGAIIVGSVAYVSIFEHNSRGMISGLAGFALTYALEITDLLNWIIRMFTTAELQMVRIECCSFHNSFPFSTSILCD